MNAFLFNRFSGFFCLLIFFVTCLAFNQTLANEALWYSLETKYLTLKYENALDLKKFDEKIEFSPDTSNFSHFSNANRPGGPNRSGELSGEKKMANKLDALVEKVQLILDMRKPINITVRIYPDEIALHSAYFEIYKKKKQLRAWYTFESNTIHVNAQDLFAGMLAHEISHAIVDHFLEVKPPRATAEILARYVDRHLTEQAKVY